MEDGAHCQQDDMKDRLAVVDLRRWKLRTSAFLLHKDNEESHS
jgi:hypothetical protein